MPLTLSHWPCLEFYFVSTSVVGSLYLRARADIQSLWRCCTLGCYGQSQERGLCCHLSIMPQLGPEVVVEALAMNTENSNFLPFDPLKLTILSNQIFDCG